MRTPCLTRLMVRYGAGLLAWKWQAGVIDLAGITLCCPGPARQGKTSLPADRSLKQTGLSMQVLPRVIVSDPPSVRAS